MFIAGTLSRAYLGEVLPSGEVQSLELVDHTENFLEGWPGNIHECDPVLHPFFQFHNALQGNLVFRGPHLFVPSTLRKEFMSVKSHRPGVPSPTS